ncbi:MBL fold metallo-hydrolase [Chloroflexota bacterium]
MTIHRGTHEIGGSCLELVSNSGQTRIVVDVGMPLINPDGSQFEWTRYKRYDTLHLLREKILPPVRGLFQDNAPTVSAVLLSHAHLDHYGFFRFLNPEIPLYMSAGTKSLAEVSNTFLDAGVNLESTRIIKMWRQFQVGEFSITPFLVDHSAPDAVAFLIEGDGTLVFYTGDFRGHGRKRVLLERIVAHPPPDVDYLVMEGSMIGRSEGLYPDEATVEQAMFDQMEGQTGLTFIFTSSQNLDRIVSIYRAAKRHGRTLVIDLYTAFVLDKLSALSPNIPQFTWDGVKVLFSHYHAGKLAEQDKALLYKYRSAKIDFEEIQEHPHDKVLLAKDSRYFRVLCNKLPPETKTSAIYSMWHGYLERSDLPQFLKEKCISISEIHTSGHAYISQLKKLADALKPRFVIPIHTFYPEKYHDMFSNVIQLEDGLQMNLEKRPNQKMQGVAPRRALSDEFIRRLCEGIYHPIVERVRLDKDLDMEFRGTYINIYFQGHSILNLKQNGSFSIDKKFLRGIEASIPIALKTEEDISSYLELLPIIKDNVTYCPVDLGSRSSKSRELEFEQLLIRANNLESRNNSEYIILDRQYVVNRGVDRWDLVALRWPIEKRGRPYQEGYLSVIEVKYAQNPDIQDIKNQVERYGGFLEAHLKEICDDMKNILEQKLDLGLLKKTEGQIKRLRELPMVPDIAETEVIIYLIDYNQNSSLKDRAEKAGKPDFRGKVHVALGGLALWQSNLSPFGENH